MTIKKITDIYFPAYMKVFRCIGSKCSDNCCYNWSINIDKNTYDKYQNLPSEDVKLIMNGITKLPNHNYDAYAQLLKVNNKCFFLDDSNLCTIQNKYGHNFLPIVCQTYPRRYNILNQRLELSARFSCPVVCDLLFKRDNKLTFLSEKLTGDGNYGIYNNFDEFNTLSLSGKEYFNVRNYLIHIIQNRSLSLYERIIIAGLFIQNINNKLNKEKINYDVLIDNFDSEVINNPSQIEKINNIQSNLEFQFIILNELYNLRLNLSDVSQSFKEYYNAFLKGLNITSNTEKLDLQTYKEAINQYNLSFKKKFPHLFEQYLVNCLFQDTLIDEQGTLINKYNVLITVMNMIEIVLIGMNHLEPLNIDKAVRVIQQLYKTITHNSRYMSLINTFLTQNELNNIAHMAIISKRN